MKLYHGTTSLRLQSILADGIRPRSTTGGNYSKYPSRPDLIYLTQSFPFYFGVNAIAPGNLDVEKVLVLEVDGDKLNHDLFLPDEDFVAWIFFLIRARSFEVLARSKSRM